MEVIETKIINNKLIWKFATTPKLSTYLVEFIVGEFDYVSGFTNDGIKVTIYGTIGKSELCKYPLNVAIKSLEFYEEYFSYKYPLKKCDLIGIPDFSNGAMEQLGALTFRECYLLYDPEKEGFGNRINATTIIAHEISHQVFIIKYI